MKSSSAAAVSDWQSIKEAAADFQGLAESLGFPYFLVTSRFLRPPTQLVRAAITNFPSAWIALYAEHRFVLINPAITHLRHCMAPFSWDETDHKSPNARRFYALATEHGVGDGFTVPLHLMAGELLCLSLAGARVPEDDDERWTIYAACLRFLYPKISSLRTLLLKAEPFVPLEPLSEQQRQILLLLMQGLPVKEIARMLDLHVRTVEGRLSRACARLQASSREQAMVRALTSGQVHMLSDAVQSLASVETYRSP